MIKQNKARWKEEGYTVFKIQTLTNQKMGSSYVQFNICINLAARKASEVC